ncbi:Protein esc1 [Neolecta irregularis DAH-3]|uniref:Protein esc1 n=1 Tax=Neolecta irregularis (strain DAH-3) TaxID=1198029 RepID=A0A1U7LPQ8_NEOID|nr:Protein esc1 [Neolecta irregularis DAH-3]|eukprot:OLL24532.1 Protein esc1 [Neolecta irregularis DAH-3]
MSAIKLPTIQTLTGRHPQVGSYKEQWMLNLPPVEDDNSPQPSYKYPPRLTPPRTGTSSLDSRQLPPLDGISRPFQFAGDSMYSPSSPGTSIRVSEDDISILSSRRNSRDSVSLAAYDPSLPVSLTSERIRPQHSSNSLRRYSASTPTQGFQGLSIHKGQTPAAIGRAPPIPPGRPITIAHPTIPNGQRVPNPHDQDPTPGFPYAFPDPVYGEGSAKYTSPGAPYSPPLILHSVQEISGKEGPYSRSPELRVSHKIAERKRRKVMKDSFEQLKANLPGEQASKASKADALHMANDYINQLKDENLKISNQMTQMQLELQSLRAQLNANQHCAQKLGHSQIIASDPMEH